MNLFRHPSPQEGFSLVELLVVIAMIGVLAATAIPRFNDFRASAFDSRAQQDIRSLATAQELHHALNETYADDPDDLAGFAASEGVTVAVASADATAFEASAQHGSGRRVFTWDSSADPPLEITDQQQ